MKQFKYTIISIILLFTIAIYSGTMHNTKQTFADATSNITAKSAILIDYNSKTIICEKDKDKKLPIASMVKLMTIYLTFKNIENGTLKLDQKITTSENASGMGGSQVFIDPYAEYSVNDLLKSVIMASANDASVALAECICGSEESFVIEMNKTAKELGMENTLYANSTGLPSPEQYSTAYDCAILLGNVLQFEKYHEYSNIWMDQLTHPSGRKTELVNTNKLIKYYNGCDCGKTGSTNEAGYCLTTSAQRDGMRLISVVIGAKTGKDRFKESTELLNYGFANYQNKLLISNEIVIKELQTKKCKQPFAEIIAKENYYAFDKKGNKSNYDISYNLPEFIGATKAGEKVGEAIVSKDGKVVKIVDLTVKNDITKLTFKDNFNEILKNW